MLTLTLKSKEAPTIVSYCFGKRVVMASWMQAASAAFTTCSSVASKHPYRMFCKGASERQVCVCDFDKGVI